MATAPMLAAPHSSAALLHWLDLLPQEHRLASRSPIPGSGLEYAGERRSTIHAGPVLGKMPAGEFEPVAADQQPATAAAPGAAARPVMNIACIDISQAVGAGDIAGARQARSGSCRLVAHLPVRMERSQMQRHVGTEGISHPAAQRIDLAIGIVLAGDQQCGDLKPDTGVSFEIEQGVKHVLKMAAADPPVEILGERL